MKKKVLAILMIAVLGLGILPTTAISSTELESKPVVIQLNQYSVLYAYDSPIRIQNNRIMVPIDMAEELLGASTKQMSDAYTMSLGNDTISLSVNSNIVSYNGKSVEVDTKPYVDQETKTVFIPIRTLIDGFGFEAHWDNTWKQLSIQDERIMNTETLQLIAEFDSDGWEGSVDNPTAFRIRSFQTERKEDDSRIQYKFIIELQNITGETIPQGKMDIAYWIMTDKSFSTNSIGSIGASDERPPVGVDETIKKEITDAIFKENSEYLVDYLILWPRTSVKEKKPLNLP